LDATRITQLALYADTIISLLNPTIPVLKAFRFTGDGSSPSPRTRIGRSVRFNDEYRTAAIGNPYAPPVTIRTPGVILAARGITQLPLNPHPSHGIGLAIGISPLFRFTGDSPLSSSTGTIGKPKFSVASCGLTFVIPVGEDAWWHISVSSSECELVLSLHHVAPACYGPWFFGDSRARDVAEGQAGQGSEMLNFLHNILLSLQSFLQTAASPMKLLLVTPNAEN
jgi:hypothetical protein